MDEHPIITLLTDFGLRDPYVGIMKGIISGIAPNAKIIDLTHLIPPQDIRAGALALDRSCKYFPPSTIHLAVVDPGVGTERHALAMRIDRQLFIGPDNGLFTFIIQWGKENRKQVKAFKIENPRFRLEPVSPVFHGRDLFAPAAAYLAAGAALEDFGPEITNPFVLSMAVPERTSSGWVGEIWAVDHFGSLETNFDNTLLSGCDPKRARIHIAEKIIDRWVTTFAEGKPGELVLLIDSADRLCISVVNGSAAKELGVGVGTPVELLVY